MLCICCAAAADTMLCVYAVFGGWVVTCVATFVGACTRCDLMMARVFFLLSVCMLGSGIVAYQLFSGLNVLCMLLNWVYNCTIEQPSQKTNTP